jgi:hypothetical protein
MLVEGAGARMPHATYDRDAHTIDLPRGARDRQSGRPCQMDPSALRRTLLLAAAASLTAALLALFFAGRTEPDPLPSPPPGIPVSSGPGPAPVTGGTAAADRAARSAERSERAGVPEPDDHAAVPFVEDRDARLHGRVTRERYRGLAATLECVAGPNLGVTLRCGRDGTFHSGLLLRGYARFSIRVPGESEVQREVVLLPDRLARLEVDFGAHGFVHGSVVTIDGVPLAGASVTCDGVETATDASGSFVLARRASAPAWIEVRLAGFATQHVSATQVALPRAGEPPGVRVRLQDAGALELAPAPLGDDRPAELFLFPGTNSAAAVADAYPWAFRLPLVVCAGESLTLRDLPAVELDVVAFHPLAAAGPIAVRVDAGRTTRVDIPWQRAPQLRVSVTADGQPVASVPVVCRAQQRPRAVFLSLGRQGHQWRALPVGLLPAAWQGATTDAHGIAILGVWELAEVDRFVIVQPPGAPALRRKLEPGQRALSIELGSRR